jgi:hypothetical protein
LIRHESAPSKGGSTGVSLSQQRPMIVSLMDAI